PRGSSAQQLCADGGPARRRVLCSRHPRLALARKVTMARLTDVAIFADCGVTAHQALYRQAGETIARHGAHLYCLACNGQWPRALIESALASGGRVTVATGPMSRRL